MALDDKEESFVAKSNGRPAVSLLKFGTYGAMYLSHFRDGRTGNLVSPLRYLEESYRRKEEQWRILLTNRRNLSSPD
jgi:hypothetical protein